MVDIPAGVMNELLALYRELDDEVAQLGPSCKQCGRCCHFAESGLRLFMGPLEASVFFEQPLPGGLTDKTTCPYLVEGVCANRSGRSIGCRTYFCDPLVGETLGRIHERYLNRTKDSATRIRMSWRYVSLSEWMEHRGPG